MIPTIGKNFKKIHEVKVTCPAWLNMELPNKEFNFFFLAIVAMITVKTFFTHFHSSSYLETYFFIKIMQPISLDYNWENGVKQIKFTEENLLQSCILCQLLRALAKVLASGLKCIKFLFIFTTICFISCEWMWFI